MQERTGDEKKSWVLSQLSKFKLAMVGRIAFKTTRLGDN